MKMDDINSNADKTAIAAVHDDNPSVDITLSPLNSDEQEIELNWRVWPTTFAFMLTWCGWQSSFNLVSPILTYINADIGPYTNYTWMVATIPVGIAVVWPIAGSLSDTLGRRYFFLVGLASGIIGSIIACTAQSVRVVIVGTAFIGFGTAIQQMIIAAISEIYPNKYRGYAQASISFASAPFAATGPLVSHLIIERLNWRWTFYLTILIDSVAFLLIALFYHPRMPNRQHSRRELLKQTDWVGLSLFALGLTTFMVGISWAGSQYSWASAAVLVPVIGGVTVLVLCGVWETYFATNPIFPPYLFVRFKSFTNILAICFVASMPLLSLLSFWPVQVGNMYTTDVRQIGIWTLPLTCGTVLGGVSIATIRLWRPTNYYIAGCACILTIFAGLLSSLGPGDIDKALAYSFLYGTAVGVLEIAVIIIIQFSTGPEHIGKVTGLLSSSRGVAGSCGISIYASILETRLSGTLPARVAGAALPLGLPPASLPALIGIAFAGTFADAGQIPGVSSAIIEATVEARKQAFAYSFQPIHWLGTALGGVAVILAFFTNDISHMMNNQLNVDLKEQESSHLTNLIHHHDSEAQKQEGRPLEAA